jgi:hypothetical protein
LTSNWIHIVSPAATLIIAFVANWYLKRQLQINGLQDAFKILNSRDHRNSRRRVYELHNEYLKNKNLAVFDQVEVEDVRADFDVIGILVKSGNVDKELFMIEFGPLAYRCWTYLKEHIEDERKPHKRNFEYYMENFEWLADEADKYWKHKKDLSKTNLYD